MSTSANRAKTATEIASMRQGGRLLATVLDLLVSQTRVGVTGRYLADLAAREIKALGAEPAFLGVPGPAGVGPFPDVICISVSEVVQHGIPNQIPIKAGDLVNFDFGVRYNGLITDAGRTIAVGQIDDDSRRLLDGTQKALAAGLAQVRAGARVSQISQAIEAVLTGHRLGIVRELVGHGVGHSLHEEPEIPNYLAGASRYRLKLHQTIAVEPIATLGSGRIYLDADGWTLWSQDQTLAAHFEETVLVTETGCQILTAV